VRGAPAHHRVHGEPADEREADDGEAQPRPLRPALRAHQRGEERAETHGDQEDQYREDRHLPVRVLVDHHPLALDEQPLRERAAEARGVLDRPASIRPAGRPASQLAVSGARRRDADLGHDLSPVIDGGRGAAPLVRVDPDGDRRGARGAGLYLGHALLLGLGIPRRTARLRA
jgi:hypothetical protein